ncbi:MAG: peptidylprolyl isomerase [Pseudomonadota bacterium]
MKIAKNSVVMMEYTLTDDKGTVIDTTEGREPLAYLHGYGNIIVGLEKELEGKTKGAKLQVNVSPEEGYGHFDQEAIRTVDIGQFEDAKAVEIGMQFVADTDDGPVMFTVREVNGADVVLDGNHPLAGTNLSFSVEVIEVREASKEELAHGHVHGAGGHHH